METRREVIRPKTHPHSSIGLAILAGLMALPRPTVGAELAPEVRAVGSAGETQRVIIHLVGSDETKRALTPDTGVEGRLAAVEMIMAPALDAIASSISGDDLGIDRVFKLQPAFAAEISAAGLAALDRDPRVASVEADRRWHPQTVEGIELIGADILHQQGVSGEGTAVAIIDTGVDYLHPTLGGGQIPNAKVVYGLDTADGDSDPMDCHGHGTAVASVAAGASYHWSPSRRFAGGVAPAAKILAYKVTSDDACQTATTSAVIEAIEDAVLHRDGDGYRLASINISLGSGEFTGPCDLANLAYAEAIDAATDVGISVIAAGGNGGYPNALNAPACITRTISVGSAWDIDPGYVPYQFCLDPECTTLCDDSYSWKRAVTCYSNSSPYLDLVAPSEYLKAAAAGSITVDFGGSSGAAAYVTGAMALMAQLSPETDPTGRRFLLAATGRPTMDDKNGLIRPIVDLARAVEAADSVVVSEETAIPIAPTPDTPTVSSVYVDRDDVVGDLEVLLDLAHPAPDQLRIVLTSPGGIEAVLHDQGEGPDGISGTYPHDLEPIDSLGRFAGTAMRGVWTLSVVDLRLSINGDEDSNLIGWALKLAEPVAPPFDAATMVFPVIARAEGVNDTHWRSDVRLFNPTQSHEAEIRLLMLPASGSGDSEPRQANVIVPHRSVVALDDLVRGRFGLEQAQGSLLVQDVSGILSHGSSRTYTTSESGTYGQFVAPLIDDRSTTGAGDAAIIVIPTAGADHRVNLGITETTGESASVAVTLIDDQTGVAIGPSRFLSLAPHENLQLNGILPYPGQPSTTDPYLAVAVVQGEGRVTAYGSVIDNRTGDAVFITGGTPQVTPYVLIPVVARNQGQSGTLWRSDVRVLNHGSYSIHLDVELRFQGALGLPAVIETIELRPGEATTIDDVVGSLFGFDEVAGSLRLVPREGPSAICAASRTANHGSEGTYGQFVPGVAAGQGLEGGGVILHIDKGPTTRSNLGIVETGGSSVGVEIRLRDELGRPLGSPWRMTIGPWESVQINDIFSSFGVQGQTNARVEITRDTGIGRFFAYASVIDVDSGDAIFVPVQELPN